MIWTLPNQIVSIYFKETRTGSSKFHTLSHDLVDFAILLATDKFLMLVGKFNLDTDLILSSFDEWYLVNDHHGRLDRVVRSIDIECEFLEANVGTRIRTDIREHHPNVSWRWSPHGLC